MNNTMNTNARNRRLQLLSLALLGVSLWLANSLQAATLTWTGAVNSDWQTAGNWSPAQVPTASDTVNINSGTVTATTAAQFGTLNLGGANLSGTLTVASGKTLNWTGNDTGAGIAADGAVTVLAGGTLNLSGSAGKYLHGGITNAGTVVWSGGNLNSYAISRPRIVNLAGGTFDVQGDQTIAEQQGTVVWPFQNAGLFRKSAGTGSLTLGSWTALNNTATGTVALQTGTLYLSGGGMLGGAWTLAAGTTLHLDGRTFAGSGLAQITGQGLGKITSGTVTLNLPATTLPKWDLQGGEVTLNGTVTNLDLSGANLHGTNRVAGIMTEVP